MFQKRFTFTALLFLFTFSILSAQMSTRDLLSKYHVNITSGLSRVLDRVEGNKDQPAVGARMNPLRLDSTKVFIFSGPDSIPETRVVYAYPHPDTVVLLSDTYVNAVWERATRTYRVTSGDNYGELTEDWDENTGEYVPADLLQVWGATPSSRLDSLKTFTWDGSAWQVSVALLNTHNSAGELIRSRLFFSGFAFVTNYSYNASGELSESTQGLELAPGVVVPVGRTVYTYKNGELVESVSYAKDDVTSPEVPSEKIVYQYDNARNQTLVAEYQWNVKDSLWSPIRITESTYTAQNLLQQETITQYPDTSLTRTVYAYLPTEETRRMDQLTWDKVDKKWYLDSREYYYYSASVRTLEPAALRMEVSPNPVTGMLRLEVPLNSLVTVRDMTGRTVQSQRLTQGNMLDFSHFASGTYILSAWYEGRWHVAKIVK